jgi:hypothetical protein
VLVTLTDHGRSLVSDRAARFEADMSLLLGRLEPADRDALSGLISRLLVAHAADHGIDLFATVDTEIPGAGGSPARPPAHAMTPISGAVAPSPT